MPAPNRFRLSGNAFERPAGEVVNPKTVVFLSTEGAKMEPTYFRNLNTAIHESHGDFPYVIHVLEHNRDNDTDPRHVLGLIEECKTIREGDQLLPFNDDDCSLADLEKQYQLLLNTPESFTDSEMQAVKDALTIIGIDIDYHRWLRAIGRNDGGDIFAIVIDRDASSHSRRVLEEIRTVCEKKNIVYCLSNPCFELWLLLHVLDISALSLDEKARLLENRVVSRNHTYASRLLSNCCRISDHVSLKRMQDLLLPNTKVALGNADVLNNDSGDALDGLGTTVPVLMRLFLNWLP